MGCLNAIPYGSLVSFIMITIGTAIASISVFAACHKTLRTNLLSAHYFDKFWYVKYAALAIPLALFVCALFALIFAIVTTKVYRGGDSPVSEAARQGGGGGGRVEVAPSYKRKCLMGGQCSALCLIFAFLTAMLVWTIILVGMATFVLLWIFAEFRCQSDPRASAPPSIATSSSATLTSLASLSPNLPALPALPAAPSSAALFTTVSSVVASSASSGERFLRLEQFGVFRNLSHVFPEASNRAHPFCSKISVIGPLAAWALAGVFLTVLGIINFIGSMSSLLIRLRFLPNLMDYRYEVSQEFQTSEEEDNLQENAAKS